jgi:hypothetical protein
MGGAAGLLAALDRVPRRYRMPPLPADPWGATPEVRVACAMEAARQAPAGSLAADGVLRDLFVDGLAALVSQAVAGDPAFQALVLRSSDAQVAEHVALQDGIAADRRRLRSLVDAIAHPGKLRGRGTDAPVRALARLHATSVSGDWPALASAAQGLLPAAGAEVRDVLATLLAEPSLARLQRAAALQSQPAVQRYEHLRSLQGPIAGSDSATRRGRASGDAGARAEEETLAAFRALAASLQAQDGSMHRACGSVRPLPGFPGPQRRAKDEWDAMLLRQRADTQAFDVVLLAEVKAAPVAATADWPRLHAGLARLAQAEPTRAYAFASREGEVQLHGESLRALAPSGEGLPPHVIYCCAAGEPRVPLLAPGARALLLQQPACIAYARAGDVARLATVWHDVLRAPHLRPVLRQYDTARRAREAMLHPADLLALAH